ncbi:putative mitochondrial carrier domain protein [Arabidopsis thaliana]|jgi:solute carrier family 25 phosphate transporter 23/24/25/41|uniref:Mitochondrial carrier like protein n=4 Tax=Arabidopsis TaxID=3701 RepID=Q8L7R0_ARATH|nr:Mitochondrial substrate carrier family protein [Arabidopsis thaliana]KAG7638886.1 Mitochondrial substrate/solute carrier [Arabidopsis thaliana x Arabidopsis arenosa]KAG7643487.1 Mitochondrial substrate/solute carrier [Arabidopsis suecica]AAM91520.1 putative mitochondrial carrier protein [Arabidopsis thaliana]AAN15361.1 putative mitochondrial carrier protein [Arabidopsis thaliana]AEC09462.1 Mitochondrial substrate carrier family protein [Arabidopsis thaliana]|eukprot:NP_181325.2 Mitochondrial substrate carrier family protein [Arabidopsis thaliana]
MNVDARVGVAVDGAQSALNTATTVHSSVVMTQIKPQAKLGTFQNLLAGGIAGAISKTCTAPLARLTILFQLQGMQSEGAVLSRPNLRREASRIINEEGYRAFWKGNLVTVVHRIPYTAVNFYAYEKYNLFFNSNPVVQSFIGNTSGNPIVHFVSGGLAGITAATATYPLDLVRTRLAAQRNAIYYQGIEHTFRTICREEGILGLYKGLGATLLGVGPSLAINFAAYESMKLFWHSHRPNDSDLVVSLVSGGLAGAVSSTATYPLDLVRRRMQVEGAGGRARVYNTGLFGTFKHIFKSEGFKGIYRGILPEYYKVVPGVGIVFMTYDALRRLLTSLPD